MSADLHIHVLEPPCDEATLSRFFSHTLGSKWFAGFFVTGYQGSPQSASDFKVVGETPNIWIGEVSWLKAMISDDADEYVPEPVSLVHEIVGESLPVLTPDLRDRLLAALHAPNATFYDVAPAEVAADRHRNLTEGAEQDGSIRSFLEAHMGKRLFTVSW
jgi:hypothetical protein